MKKSMKLALSAAMGVALFGAMSGSVMAQGAGGDPSQKIIPSLEYQQADVREALRALFRNVGVSYSIDPVIQGFVTVSLKNVTFEAALQYVLRQVDATYRVEGGVYEIVKREEPTTVTPDAGGTTAPTDHKVIRRIPIRHADPQFIALLIGADKGSTNFDLAPEMSTINKGQQGGGQGGGGGFGGGGGGGFGGGGGGFGGGGGGFGGGGGGGFGGGGGGFGGGGGGFGGGGGGGRGGGRGF